MGQISWNYFSKRIDRDAAQFVAATGCKTYADFVKLLASRGVIPPSEKDVATVFAAPQEDHKTKPKVPLSARVVKRSAKPTKPAKPAKTAKPVKTAKASVKSPVVKTDSKDAVKSNN